MTDETQPTPRMLAFSVAGVPGPQGSKKAVGRRKNGSVILIESSKKVKPWRELVVAAALSAAARSRTWRRGEDAPMRMRVLFIFARPASHYGTGRNAAVLKPSAPGRAHTNLPDSSKLLRSTEDALTTAGVIRDDRYLAQHDMVKVWANPGETPGATIVLTTNLASTWLAGE